MRRPLVFLLMLGLATSGLTAQVWMDTFDYPAGPNLGTWVKHLGATWMATGSQVQAQPLTKYQHLTQPSLIFRDCVVECDVDYNTQHGGLEFGGVILRANAPSQGTFGSDLLLVKVQGSTGFSATWLYEHSQTGGLSASSAGIPACTKARVRLLVIDSRLVARIDANRTGKWDVTITRTVSLPVKAGPVGITGYNGSFMDNFKVYNGVILEQVGAPAPTPGREHKMVIRGQVGASYQAATSLGNAGIVLPSGSVIPLTVDNILLASATNVLPTLFRNYRGFLDINGDATISLALPNIPALKGITLYTAFVTYSGSTFLDVSNDHHIVIQ